MRLHVELPADWARMDDADRDCWNGPLHLTETTNVPGLLEIVTLLGPEAPEMLEVARDALADAADAAGFTYGELEDTTTDTGASVGLVQADEAEGDAVTLVLEGIAWKRLDDEMIVFVRAFGASTLPHDRFAEFVFDTADSVRIEEA